MVAPFENMGFPPDFFFIALGLIVAGAFIFLAVKRNKKLGLPSLRKARRPR